MNPQILEKLARLQVMGVADEEMCQIAGVAKDVLDGVFATSEFLEIAARIKGEQYVQMEQVNRGWDAVEEFAVAKVMETLSGGFADPDYALRAAVLANKANRRGKNGLGVHQNAPLVIQPGLQSVIQLHVNLVNKLQQNLEVTERTSRPALQQKEVNCLNPAQAKSILQIEMKTDTQNAMEEQAEYAARSIAALMDVH